MMLFKSLLHIAALMSTVVAFDTKGKCYLIDGPPACPTGERLLMELAPLLSQDADILLPSSPAWDQSRSSAPRIQPSFIASVHVTTEKDVEATVKYANRLKVPFLAITGTHGWATSLNKIHGGIQINMRKLNNTKVHPDGKRATVGGGTMQYELVRSLYSQGKKLTSTGLCECVSVVGPLLGGGHSVLQGAHGFAADNLLSARLVLANGTAITVSSTSNPDLFWAIRGAGHNFGIVTSLDLAVHDGSANWTFTALIFTHDKLESVFSTWNQLEAAHPDPGLLVLNGLMARNPAADPSHPIIIVQLMHAGHNPIASVYTSAFLSLSPIINSTTTDIPYSQLYVVAATNLDSPVCRKDENLSGFPVSSSEWNVPGLRAAFDRFSMFTANETYSTSAFILESYGRGRAMQVPKEENAVAPAERELHLLASPLLWWKGDDQEVRKRALSEGEKIREDMRGKGASKHTYVNYAVGWEDLEDLYGGGLRLERLRKLKEEWDPEGRFGFYIPIR